VEFGEGRGVKCGILVYIQLFGNGRCSMMRVFVCIAWMVGSGILLFIPSDTPRSTTRFNPSKVAWSRLSA